jgi:alcohol dehydrogenase YqhD (iron-dependent ADH family)
MYKSDKRSGKMNSFTFWSPTKVVFGVDTVRTVGSEIRQFGGSNVLVLYGGGSAVRSGLLEKVTGALSEAGLRYTAVGGVQPNPRVQLVQRIVDTHRNDGIDFVLGVGGGSVLDTAKAAAHGLRNPDAPVWDYFSGRRPLEASLPVGAIPTIAAAGSETSDSAVLTDLDSGEKRGLGTPLNRPKFAIMDPTLTYTLPPRETARGVTDIMMHTLDRYFAKGAGNAVTDALAEALLRVVVACGRLVMQNPGDPKARSELMWAGSLSHNGLTGLGQAKDFSVHQLGHALSAKYDIAHGDSLSAVWGAWAKAVCREDIPRFAQFGRAVWQISEPDDEAAALQGIEATIGYFRFLGMPVALNQSVGDLSEEDINTLAELCSYRGTRTIGSFKVLGADAIREIYRAAK